MNWIVFLAMYGAFAIGFVVVYGALRAINWIGNRWGDEAAYIATFVLFFTPIAATFGFMA